MFVKVAVRAPCKLFTKSISNTYISVCKYGTFVKVMKFYFSVMFHTKTGRILD